MTVLSESTWNQLVCPACYSKVIKDGDGLLCKNPDCSSKYPIVNGIPVLINDRNSLFSVNDYLSGRDTTFTLKENKVKKFLERLVPATWANYAEDEKLRQFVGILQKRVSSPKVLIVGGRIHSKGVSQIVKPSHVELVEIDVSFGPQTSMICDAHDLPFEENTFDGVIIQSVIEHVLDPYRVVENIHRVLKPGGVVYAESPGIRQAHGGAYDFTRFTYVGHRRLFRWFKEVDSGIAVGPGSTLAWSYEYFLMSFTRSETMRLFIRAFARFTSFYLAYMDYFLSQMPGAYDGAAVFYFMGEKADTPISDQDLLRIYRGLASI